MLDIIATIKNLENELNDCDLYCNDCRKGRGEKCYPVSRETGSEALELLKEQQPRVLTFEELDALPNETDVWGENKEIDRVFAQTTYDGWFNPASVFLEGVLNGHLRYWTARPTEEQRKAVPWQER